MTYSPGSLLSYRFNGTQGVYSKMFDNGDNYVLSGTIRAPKGDQLGILVSVVPPQNSMRNSTCYILMPHHIGWIYINGQRIIDIVEVIK